MHRYRSPKNQWDFSSRRKKRPDCAALVLQKAQTTATKESIGLSRNEGTDRMERRSSLSTREATRSCRHVTIPDTDSQIPYWRNSRERRRSSNEVSSNQIHLPHYDTPLYTESHRKGRSKQHRRCRCCCRSGQQNITSHHRTSGNQNCLPKIVNIPAEIK